MPLRDRRPHVDHGGRRWPGFAALALTLALFCAALPAGAARVSAASNTVGFWKVYAPGWNLVAGPEGSHLALHGETLISLAGERPQYAESTLPTAHAGEGYWVYYNRGATLLLVGVPQPITQVHVSGGQWATIGNSGARPASVRGADIALTYTPDAGFAPAGSVQPGEAALVYADSDTDVFMDPYSPPQAQSSVFAPGGAVPAPTPPFPTTSGPAGTTPADELNYIFALNPVLTDVGNRVENFTNGIGQADPARPQDPVWQDLRGDGAAVAQDLAAVQALTAPARYAAVQTNLISALADISDGMRETVTGLLNRVPERATLGSGLLASGARRLDIALSLLPR